MAKVGAPFGVRGWVHVYADTEYPDSLFDFDNWWVGQEGRWRDTEVEEAQLHGKGMIVKFADVDDREQAALMRNRLVAVSRSELPEPDEDEFYWNDLIGMSVVNTAGDAFGVIEQLLETGANDILVVKGADKSRLIPFVKAVVLNVDLPTRVITVDWGLDY